MRLIKEINTYYKYLNKKKANKLSFISKDRILSMKGDEE